MREKPNFSKKASSNVQARNHDDWGYVWLPFVIVGGYIVSSAIARVNSHTGSWLDQIICYGILIGILVLFILGAWAQKKEKERLHEASQEWKRACKSVEVAIVSRHGYPGGSYEDEYGDLHTTRPYYYLDIAPGADQLEVSPNQASFQVKVTGEIFEKLEKRDTVRIYYKPESPLEFLFEEELSL